MYDAIVAGAGPAGCAAARCLAGRGLRTLLVEKCALPRYKSCSGQLIEKSLRLVRECFGTDVPASVACAPAENRGTVIVDGWGRELRFEQRGRNIWRSAFDAWLAGRAAEAGAELRDRVAVIACAEEGGFVRVRMKGESGEYEERARWLIDCEGAAGRVRRDLCGPGEFIATYQTFNRGRIDLDPRYFYAYLQPELSGYDAWFNVKDGMLVLGAAAPGGGDARRFHARFLEYMRAEYGLWIAEELGADGWLLPRVRPGCPVHCGRGRVLFAGEVAGLLNPMGEGVSAALESGWMAAEAVAHHIGEPERVRAMYAEGVESIRAYMRRQWNLAAGMAERFAEMRMQEVK